MVLCRESTVLPWAHPARGARETLERTSCLLPCQPCGGDPAGRPPLAKNGWLHGRRCRLQGLASSGGLGPQGAPVDPQGSLPVLLEDAEPAGLAQPARGVAVDQQGLVVGAGVR